MAERALAIDPELDIHRLGESVDAGNAERFLDGVDLYVDGFDLFVLKARQRLFELCAEHGIPAINAAPWGVRFDAYKNRLKRAWRPGGNSNPLHRALIASVSRRYASAFDAGAPA